MAIILEAWSQSKDELRSQVYELLIERDWKMLPLEIDRSKLPGFLPHWPEGDDYEVLYDLYSEAFPKSTASIDETSLMAVWLSGRLPIEKVSKAEIDIPKFYFISQDSTNKE